MNIQPKQNTFPYTDSTLRTTNISPIAKSESFNRRNPYNDNKLNAMQTLNGTKEPVSLFFFAVFYRMVFQIETKCKPS